MFGGLLKRATRTLRHEEQGCDESTHCEELHEAKTRLREVERRADERDHRDLWRTRTEGIAGHSSR